VDGSRETWKTATLKTKTMGDNMKMDLSEIQCEG
jgi:hypothetical protein